MHLWQFRTKIAQKPKLYLSAILLPRQKKPIHRTWLCQTQPRSIPFATKLITPHFWYICANSSLRLHKNYNSTYSPILLPRQRKPIHRTWLNQNQTKIISLSNQTFHTSFLIYLWQFPTKIAQKPKLHLFTKFATKAKKANPPNLAKWKYNQDQFLLQPNFSHLIFDAFVPIPHQGYTKTITSLIHQFCYQGKESQSTELG